MEEHDLQEISGTLTRKQWKEVVKALKTRRSFVNKAVREGTTSQQDRLMLDALIDYINSLLRN